MRPTAKGTLAGVVAFAATTIATIAVTTLASGGHIAAHLDPLRPDPQSTSTSTDLRPTTRTELTFPVEGGTAGAFLVTPEGGAEVGVVIVAGSGPTDRTTHLQLAEQFAAHGIAALTYDKRTENYSAFHWDFALLADDLLAAAEGLRAATDIDRVGAWGTSEGGWVVADAAARPGGALAFAVLAAAPVVSPGEQAAWIVDRAIQGAPGAIRLAAATVVAQGGFLLDYLDFDTRSRLATTTVPVMAIWGADDEIVPVNEAWRRLDDGLEGPLLGLIAPGVGHDMRADVGAWLPAVTAWIREPDGEGLVGVEPAWNLGVAAQPAPRWYADPRLHLAASILIAAFVAVTVARRSTRTNEGTSA